MRISFFRLASLALAVTASLVTASLGAPTLAADATLGGADEAAARLALRQGKLPPSILTSPRSRRIAVSDLPDERRSVRVVYQGYGEPGAVLRPSN